MMKKKNVFFLFFLVFLWKDPVYAFGVRPYCIDCSVSLFSTKNEFKYAGLDVTFYNNSNKDIKSFTLTLYLYDENGNPPFSKNCVTVENIQGVQAYGTVEFCISLDEYITVVPEEPYRTDSVYADRIEYEDETVWTDPCGLYAVQ
ncbi:MAG: hypothetical protein WCR31_01860 [Treponema sp.]